VADRERTTARRDAPARAMAVLERAVDSAADARSWIDQFLAAEGIDEDVRDNAQLIVSELVTNALMHGDGAPVVRASASKRVVHIAVTDSGDELPEVLPFEPGRIGGLGLVIVGRIADEWGTSAFPGGKTVWASINLPR
jgi:anti-sigma regulatory factor (Ser/Thr protein kinase)